MYEARCRRTLTDDITLQGIQSVNYLMCSSEISILWYK